MSLGLFKNDLNKMCLGNIYKLIYMYKKDLERVDMQ